MSSAQAAVVPEALLGLPVRHRQLRLGTVSAVLVSADEAVLGMVVTSSWGGPEKVLPLPAAFVTADGIESTPLALLSEPTRRSTSVAAPGASAMRCAVREEV